MGELTLTIYGLKTCDTCRKAKKVLEAGGHSVTLIDVREDGVPADILARAIAEFGDALVNRKSTTWRNLSEEERAGDPADLLTQHPTLMKRPLIKQNGTMTLGWTSQVQLAYS